MNIRRMDEAICGDNPLQYKKDFDNTNTGTDTKVPEFYLPSRAYFETHS